MQVNKTKARMWDSSRIKSVFVTLSTVLGRDMRGVKFLSVLTVYLVLVTLPSDGMYPFTL